jgi:hypothetical protein
MPEFTKRLLDLFRAITQGPQAKARPVCLICGARTFQPEDQVTGFATKEEGAPFLQQLERQQEMARRFFAASKG